MEGRVKNKVLKHQALRYIGQGKINKVTIYLDIFIERDVSGVLLYRIPSLNMGGFCETQDGKLLRSCVSLLEATAYDSENFRQSRVLIQQIGTRNQLFRVVNYILFRDSPYPKTLRTIEDEKQLAHLTEDELTAYLVKLVQSMDNLNSLSQEAKEVLVCRGVLQF